MTATSGSPVLSVLERYPELSQTFVEGELRELVGLGVPVEALALAPGFLPPGAPAPVAPVNYVGDRRGMARVGAAVALAGRRPLPAIRYLVGERSWPPPNGTLRLRGLARLAPWRALAAGARHIHAHFATEATDMARILSSFSGTRFSFAAHAFDAFQEPEALRRNLAESSFCVTDCEYNLRYMASVAPELAEKVTVLVLGADLERFRRRRPYDPDGPVVAVGRLVAQKGFDDLVEAAARAREALGGREVLIVGEGPERGPLEERIQRTHAPVRLLGARGPDEVRDLFEGASLSVLSCVIAPDGDRDSMPVVLKEAMALELPVIGTEEVGLPELIGPDRGRLVPPRRPDALASAIAEILRLDPEELIALGRAGRAFVEEHCDQRVQATRLLRLIEEAEES